MREIATVSFRSQFHCRKALCTLQPVLWLCVAILQLSLVTGCNDDANGTPSSALSSSVSGSVYEALGLPPPWTAPAEFDCNTAGPVKRSDITGKSGGFWSGTLVDCVSGQSEEVLGLISQDGRFRIFSSRWGHDESDLLRGTLEMDGDTFASHGKYFFSEDTDCADCRTTALFMEGFVSDRQHLEGRWIADWGGFGYFILDYLGVQYEDQISDIVWSTTLTGGWDGIGPGFGYSGISWMFDDAGRLNGSDSSGCTYTGRTALVDSRYNLMGIEVTVSACEAQGTYAGFAMKSSGPFNDGLWVSVDDGEERALRLFFLTR